MEKKVYELEMDFIEAFEYAVARIREQAGYYNEPMTLEKVLEFGFNNVCLNGKKGYDKDDFSQEELKKHVDFSDWDLDDDMYRTVYLTEVE